MPAGDRRKRRLNTIYLYIILKPNSFSVADGYSLNTIYLYIILKPLFSSTNSSNSLNTIYLYIILKRKVVCAT